MQPNCSYLGSFARVGDCLLVGSELVVAWLQNEIQDAILASCQAKASTTPAMGGAESQRPHSDAIENKAAKECDQASESEFQDLPNAASSSKTKPMEARFQSIYSGAPPQTEALGCIIVWNGCPTSMPGSEQRGRVQTSSEGTQAMHQRFFLACGQHPKRSN